MISNEALKKLQEQIAAWPMTQRFVVQKLIEDYRRNREDLRAYEATGLTPEEVLPKDKADEIALKLMRLADLEILCSYTRLRELAEADKNGRVMIAPCKVGDTLFRVFAGEILEHKVSNMRYLAIQGRWDIDTTPFCSYVESSIGKTVFLTREEAEKALEAMQNV